MDKVIREICQEVIEELDSLKQRELLPSYSFNIKCDELREQDWTNIDITKIGRYTALFDDLKKINSPVLYWIEITSLTPNSEIYNAISKYGISSGSGRVIPALSPLNSDRERSKVLYVGKVIRGYYGRVIQHFGYFKTPATQGLQLAHWTEGLKLELKFNYMPFPESMAGLMEVVEYGLAKRLHPIVGTHK